jgi:NitT/TauT family transport system permease protein
MKERQIAAYCVTITLIYAAWYILSLVLGSTVLPDPVSVFIQGFREIGVYTFWTHVAASTFRIIAALFLAFVTATPLGLLLGSTESLDRLFSPLIYLGYPIPKIVLMPIIFVIFGLGDTAKIVLITMIVFFQLLITTRDAARKIDKEVVYSLQSLGGSRWDFYRHVVWPVSLPGIFTSLRIVTGTSIAVLFFVESIGTNMGLGYYIIDAWGRADYTNMFVGIIAFSIIGIVLYETFDLLERKLCKWKGQD